MSDIDRHDLEACGDVFDWLCENADSLSTEKAIEMLEASQAVLTKLKAALSMLETQALNTIEQPILIGSVAYAKKPSIKYRPNQTKIAAKVVAQAWRDLDTGEIFDPERSAERAVRLMKDLYVSPSTVPKVGGVKNLGLKMDDVTTEERTGFELRRTVID